jgi:RNA polymerase sigma factor (sigma-70 family)
MSWGRVIQEIRDGNEEAERELYSTVSACARGQLYQSMDPGAADDHVQEILMVVLAAIRSGELRDPRCLMGFVRMVTRRQASLYIRSAIVLRKRMIPMEAARPASPAHESPEARFALRERSAALGVILSKLSARDRDILVRFYFDDQNSEDICHEMHLSATHFRLFKSRALAKCCELSNRTRPRVRVQSTKPLRIA